MSESEGGVMNSQAVRKIFLDGVINLIGDYERYTSKLG
jgi:hypothetical protein